MRATVARMAGSYGRLLRRAPTAGSYGGLLRAPTAGSYSFVGFGASP